MPQITGAIVLANGQATPVNVSFVPEKITSEEAIFVDRSSASPLGFRRLILKMNRASGTRPTDRVTVEFSYPEIATVSGVVTLLHTARFQSGSFIIPTSMTAAARADLYAFVKNALGSSLVQSYVRDLDSAW